MNNNDKYIYIYIHTLTYLKNFVSFNLEYNCMQVPPFVVQKEACTICKIKFINVLKLKKKPNQVKRLI
jgi:hypothetical protein